MELNYAQGAKSAVV